MTLTIEATEAAQDVVYDVCPACEFITYNVPRSNETAHEELCCGATDGPGPDGCAASGDDICVTHEYIGGIGLVEELTDEELAAM